MERAWHVRLASWTFSKSIAWWMSGGGIRGYLGAVCSVHIWCIWAMISCVPSSDVMINGRSLTRRTKVNHHAYVHVFAEIGDISFSQKVLNPLFADFLDLSFCVPLSHIVSQTCLSFATSVSDGTTCSKQWVCPCSCDTQSAHRNLYRLQEPVPAYPYHFRRFCW